MKTISAFYCLLYATWAEGASINAEGPEGGEVSFKCSHSLAWKNNKYLCRDPCKVSEDKLVTVKSGQRAEAERIILEDSGDGVFTVTFIKLQLSDSGRYWCAVDRPGFDTFTDVHLTVKEGTPHDAVTNATTTRETFPTMTYQSVTNSTGLIFQTDTSANNSQAHTNGKNPSIKTSTVLYSTAGAVALLIVLVLVMRFKKKCKEKSRPQPQVCSNSTNLISVDENKDMGDDKTNRDPLTSASAAADTAAHIYENICCSKTQPSAHSRDSAANVQNNTYIMPLPTVSKHRNAQE